MRLIAWVTREQIAKLDKKVTRPRYYSLSTTIPSFTRPMTFNPIRFAVAASLIRVSLYFGFSQLSTRPSSNSAFHVSDQRPPLVFEHVCAVAGDLLRPRVYQHRRTVFDSRLHVVTRHIESVASFGVLCDLSDNIIHPL